MLIKHDLSFCFQGAVDLGLARPLSEACDLGGLFCSSAGLYLSSS